MNEYNFKHDRRGIAVIICNGEFDGLDPRAAAENDKKRLIETCRTLGFADNDIRAFSNLTANDMVKELMDVSKEDFSECDCVLVAISSHGGVSHPKDILADLERLPLTAGGGTCSNPTRLMHHYVTDGEIDFFMQSRNFVSGTDYPVHIDVLMELFYEEKCRTLKDKPKIFIYQCCRGEELMNTVTIAKPAPTPCLNMDVTEDPTPATGAEIPTVASMNTTTDGARQTPSATPDGSAQSSADIGASGGGGGGGDEQEVDTTDARMFKNVWNALTSKKNKQVPADPGTPSLSQQETAVPAANPGGDAQPTPAVAPPRRVNYIVSKSCPVRRDFVAIHSVPEGYFAFSRPSGSPFLRYLCQGLQELHETNDLMGILTEVNFRIATGFHTNAPGQSFHNKRFVPSIEDGLLKDVHFHPKPTPADPTTETPEELRKLTLAD